MGPDNKLDEVGPASQEQLMVEASFISPFLQLDKSVQVKLSHEGTHLALTEEPVR